MASDSGEDESSSDDEDGVEMKEEKGKDKKIKKISITMKMVKQWSKLLQVRSINTRNIAVLNFRVMAILI